MTPLEETLYNFILDNDLEARYQQTAYHRRRDARDALGRLLWQQLAEPQRLLLEQLQRAYDRTQDCELEATIWTGNMPRSLIRAIPTLLGRGPPPTSPAGR